MIVNFVASVILSDLGWDEHSWPEEQVPSSIAVNNLALPLPKTRKLMSEQDALLVVTANACMERAREKTSLPIPERRGCIVLNNDSQLDDLRPYFAAGRSCIFSEAPYFDSAAFGREALSEINPIASIKILPNNGLAHVCQSLDIRGYNASMRMVDQAVNAAIQDAVLAIVEGRIDGCIIASAFDRRPVFQSARTKPHLQGFAPSFLAAGLYISGNLTELKGQHCTLKDINQAVLKQVGSKWDLFESAGTLGHFISKHLKMDQA